ncbi:hypothetical protein NHH03_07845 [Stieleria sp. TO1_6]|uniref:hypothetical protein n=1 Tax=Stieleria tagensis TaxID=2956795 RepID=UPI00209B8E47|nr:hypothetical protein [Stieleria tagensis]MCO8121645.1 hypothetical protein [Stieleria tagensis]
MTTVFALLIHSILGCSLHHACGCDARGAPMTQSSAACDHLQTVAAVHSPSVQHPCCHHHDDDSDRGLSNQNLQQNSHSVQHERESAAAELSVACGCCEQTPCDGNDPGCHTSVGCSFVSSNDVNFLADTPTVAFVIDCGAADCGGRAGVVPHRDARQHCLGADSSLSHCALLCTWLI